MVVHYPSSYEAHRVVVEGQSLIIKSHRLYNYMRLPVGIPRPGVIAFMCISAFAGGLILSDVCTAIFPTSLPSTYNKAYFRKMAERRKELRMESIKYHKIGQPVRADEFI